MRRGRPSRPLLAVHELRERLRLLWWRTLIRSCFVSRSQSAEPKIGSRGRRAPADSPDPRSIDQSIRSAAPHCCLLALVVEREQLSRSPRIPRERRLGFALEVHALVDDCTAYTRRHRRDLRAKPRTSFTWRQDERGKLLGSRQGKKQQWDAAERIDWSIDLDPEESQELDDRAIRSSARRSGTG